MTLSIFGPVIKLTGPKRALDSRYDIISRWRASTSGNSACECCMLQRFTYALLDILEAAHYSRSRAKSRTFAVPFRHTNLSTSDPACSGSCASGPPCRLGYDQQGWLHMTLLCAQPWCVPDDQYTSAQLQRSPPHGASSSVASGSTGNCHVAEPPHMCSFRPSRRYSKILSRHRSSCHTEIFSSFPVVGLFSRRSASPLLLYIVLKFAKTAILHQLMAIQHNGICKGYLHSPNSCFPVCKA